MTNGDMHDRLELGQPRRHRRLRVHLIHRPDPVALGKLFEQMGFTTIAKHRHKDVTLYRQGEINFIVNAASLEAALKSVTLDDKYTLERGRAYMSGIQALVRLRCSSRSATRLPASILPASPVIAVSPRWSRPVALEGEETSRRHQIVFQPGVNEDLAATAVRESQQVNLYPSEREVRQRVFDVVRQGSGRRPFGQCLQARQLRRLHSTRRRASAGRRESRREIVDARAHQSEHIFKACGLPVLFPSNVQEYLDFGLGLHGWAMSRYSGLWVAMKCVIDVVESSALVDIDQHRTKIVIPTDFAMPDGGLNIRWPDPPLVLVQEARLLDYK